MIKYSLISLRVFCLFIITVVTFILCLSLYYILSYKKWAKIIHSWSFIVQKASGVKLIVHGKQDSNYLLKNHLILANHISWLDIVALYSIYSIQFVAKVEIKHWPFLGVLAKASGCIFINRNKRRDILIANQLISHELQKERCVGFFPEGGVNNGRELLPFKSPLLEAAIHSKSTIVPIILMYYRKDGSVAEETFYHGRNLLQAIFNTLGGRGIRVEAFILPKIDTTQFNSRLELAGFIHSEMQKVFHEKLNSRLVD